MQFVKMHGAGNDYIFVDCLDRPAPEEPADLARRMSDRHFGIGGDGLILILPSDVADARMRMFNADGSEAEMCGNGLRCFAKYLYDRTAMSATTIAVETGRGVLTVDVFPDARGSVHSARISMRRPILEAANIPTTLPGNPPLDVPLEAAGRSLSVCCVSMGNPHCVLFVDELTDELVRRIGPAIELHPAFPQRTNVEFARVRSPHELELRVWERGSGETLACGTGACAAAVAGRLTGRLSASVACRLPGGVLSVEVKDDDVLLTGSAVDVFRGQWLGG